ncbi:MAG: acetate--CoA ligase family protein [Candidatus Micrarchaeia archaeon]
MVGKFAGKSGREDSINLKNGEIPNSASGMEKRMLSFTEASGILGMHGIKTIGKLATSWWEAEAIANGHNAPLAMKVISRDVIHNTEQNAVVLGIAPNNAVSAYNGLMRNFGGMRVGGILIPPMVKGIEFFIGATRDEQFGPVVTQQPRCGSLVLQSEGEHLGEASPSLSQAQAFRPGLLTFGVGGTQMEVLPDVAHGVSNFRQ